MSKKAVSPDSETARKLLDNLWSDVIKEQNGEIDPDIDKLINSGFVSIRYSLLTQLLGKYADNKLDCLCLQKGSGDDDSLWDPRGFASKVVVPWVADNESVLGTSSDPYVSKPLRKKRLESNPGDVKGKEWILLYKVLKEVEERDSPDYTLFKLKQTLKSIHKKLTELTFDYPVPERISLKQTEELVRDFLSESSGGDRGLSVTAALFETFGKHFKLFKEVKRHVINASDEATGLAGDIECIDESGTTKLAIEVKERNLTLTDVSSSIIKARNISLREILFNAPGVVKSEEKEINEFISTKWASGTNIYILKIQELLKVGLSLTGEEGRKDFIKNVGNQLNQYNTQPSNRKRWKDLLEKI